MTYQSYPTGAGANDLAPRGPQPPSVRNAVRLMWAGAAIAVISLIVTLIASSQIKKAVNKAALKANLTAASKGKTPLTAAQIHTLENATIVVLAVVLVISVALWAWMAWANGKGASWARVVATVLFGLNTLDVLFSASRAGVSAIFGLVSWLVGLAAVVFLWRKESSAFFAQSGGRVR
jgi:hypothetical protein